VHEIDRDGCRFFLSFSVMMMVMMVMIDRARQQVDLVGGYYDAGDHVKFGLPMAFTVTMLSWSLIEYGADVAAAGELGHALEAVKWGTDYFVKAHTRPDELWAEVIINTTVLAPCIHTPREISPGHAAHAHAERERETSSL
jgi:hypothetical protein